MGTNFTELVDPYVSLEDAPPEGARMVAWLQARGIIGLGRPRRELWHGCRESPPLIEPDRIVYPPGPNFRNAHGDADHPDDDSWLHTQSNNEWFHVASERGVYLPGGTFQIRCPRCGEDQLEYGEAWSEAISAWYRGQPENLVCAACGYDAALSEWVGGYVDSPWGFGYLAFSFESWSLRLEFIKAFERKLGRPLIVVPVWL